MLQRAGSVQSASVTSHSVGSSRRAWRPSILTLGICIVLLGASAVGLYPSAASWVNSYNQSQVIGEAVQALSDLDPNAEEQLEMAQRYNDALTSGVLIPANTNVAEGAGTSSDSTLDYESMLKVNNEGYMGRIRIKSIGVDLPMFHGTSEETLLKGAGHLEGSHLPIGGESTRSVITAHRGLADATMFTNLDQLEVGDTFVVEVLGETLTYQIGNVQVIAPDDTDTLKAEPGRDLVTLITCTPLGLNTHRIVVTGERVSPTPESDLAAAGEPSEEPGFPWWAAGGLGAIVLVTIYLWRSGYSDSRLSAARQAASSPIHSNESLT